MQEVELVLAVALVEALALAAAARGCVVVAALPPVPAGSSSAPWCSLPARQPTDCTIGRWSSAAELMVTPEDCPPIVEEAVDEPPMAESSEVKAERSERTLLGLRHLAAAAICCSSCVAASPVM